MATERQIAANRENAKQSTGPHTEGGKAASSSNALRHGLASRGLIIIPGHEEAFEQFQSDLRASLVPSGPLQELLFNRALTSAWISIAARKRKFSSTKNRAVRTSIPCSAATSTLSPSASASTRAKQKTQCTKGCANSPNFSRRPSTAGKLKSNPAESAQAVSEICRLKRVRTTVATQNRNEAKARAINLHTGSKRLSSRNEPIPAAALRSPAPPLDGLEIEHRVLPQDPCRRPH
jgi:hypothetical protein